MSSTETSTIKKDGFAYTNIGAFSKYLTDGPGENTTKQFFRDMLGLSGIELSITAYPAGTGLSFFHSHKQNEETYIVVQGEGQMQLDSEVIELKEGSVVRVLPATSRLIKAGPNSDLVFICIQAKLDSLEQCSREDGQREKTEPLL